MGVVMVVKDYKTDSFYIAANSSAGEIPFNSPRQYIIQKFDNFILCTTGRMDFFKRMACRFDFNSLTTPLTKEVLYDEFYPEFLKYLEEYNCVEHSNGCIDSFKDDFIFVQDGKAFDVFDNRIIEINSFGGAGMDNSIAYAYGRAYYETKDAKELAIDMIKKTIGKKTSVHYPIHLMNSRSDILEIINKDGTVKQEKMECLWRLNNNE